MLINTSTIQKIVSIQTHLISRDQVIEDLKVFSIDKSQYKNLINQYCEQIHQQTNKPRTQICQFIIDELYGLVDHEIDWIRKRIDEKYKSTPRVRNGRLRSTQNRLTKIPQKINQLEQQFAELTKYTIDYASKE